MRHSDRPAEWFEVELGSEWQACREGFDSPPGSHEVASKAARKPRSTAARRSEDQAKAGSCSPTPPRRPTSDVFSSMRTRGLRRTNGGFTSEVFYFDVVKSGLSTDDSITLRHFAFLLYYYHREPRVRKTSSAIRGMRSSRCWVLGGNCGGNQRADEAQHEAG